MKIEIIEYDHHFKKDIPILFTNTIHKTCNKDYTQAQLDAWANPNIDFEIWEKKVAKTKPYLAIIQNKLVGFVEFYEDYIDCFYIHHQYQGMGVGKSLMEHVLSIAKNNNISKIKVDVSITAKPFFEKFGFKQVKMNHVKRCDEELINFSMQLDNK
ncbi:MAG: GNAT family N-acetyltransferase [Arcobacter sp.]|uniref:GNAT family N-acetyltransferase n=1 Tax=uncultured Arcobacter sp. TaxID=165434 RepID=UPI000CB2FAD5|nr:GNAT family N-acetyltransferase [uncultured Arcobacter sp.]PLY11507.1 MAG: GNAT family N-acetyltransferase [Arcobacter sp.]